MQDNLKTEALDFINCDLDKLKAKIGKSHLRDGIQLCSLVNAKSGRCSEDCKFCAQSAHYKTHAEYYPLINAANIYEKAVEAAKLGIHDFGIVTSGPKLRDKEVDEICKSIENISKEEIINVCASLGKLSIEQLNKLKSAGLKRYHHNLETSKNFFPQICTAHTWEERVETVQSAKAAGLKVCSGGLFGLGESWEDRIDLALTLKELDVDCAPINFLNPIPGTPFAINKKLAQDEALKIIALYRFILSDKSIRLCGGRPAVFGDKHDDFYDVGANAIMTGNYLTVYGISPEKDIEAIKSGFRFYNNPKVLKCY